MTYWERWLRQPQGLWLRRALFQIHLWTGIGVGLYVVVISVTGSAVVFRPELYQAFWPGPRTVVASGSRLTLDQIKASAERAYPGYSATQAWNGKKPEEAVEVWLEDQRSRGKQRLFDPYTGHDLGDAVPPGIRAVAWLVNLHDNLLAGPRGRTVNGVGAILLVVLCLTGATIWWPGLSSWRRSLVIRWRGNWKRVNWDLHNAIGFWLFALVLMWAVTGVYLVFPAPFMDLVDYLQPFDESSPTLTLRSGDVVLRWLTNLHFGRFAGWPVKALWVVLGLVPAGLFVTGALMWWNRVLRNNWRRESDVA
jgi:uncharacterized iron-regulated membrane protein